MKAPAFQLYPGDHQKDAKIGRTKAATRGVWWEIVMMMHNEGTFQVADTLEMLARNARVTLQEMHEALEDLRATGAADVSENAGVWTVVSRRRRREIEARSSANTRQIRHRRRKKQPPVTPVSQLDLVTPVSRRSSSSSSDLEKKISTQLEDHTPERKALPSARNGLGSKLELAWKDGTGVIGVSMAPLLERLLEYSEAHQIEPEALVPRVVAACREVSERNSDGRKITMVPVNFAREDRWASVQELLNGTRRPRSAGGADLSRGQAPASFVDWKKGGQG